MEVNHHIFFRRTDEPLLYIYLVKNSIPFKEGEFCSLDISESNPHWKLMNRITDMERRTSYSYMVFTKKELLEAQWLTIRSKGNFAYPQPESKPGYMEGVYAPGFCWDCASISQIGSFRIKKAPKWGRRSFAMLHWVGDELFVCDRAKEIFQDEGITGIDYLPVLNKKGSEVLPGVYQLMLTHVLEKGLVLDKGVRETSVCSYCGVEKYLASQRNTLTYRKEIFENAPDFAKSCEVFGAGHYAAHKLFINQRVYHALTKHSLLQGLDFEPVSLV
ncbi:MAG: hypothetical protein IJ466_04080 [Clostridia bacterium]|nr:hypothetical protein [Clostridia bacterium]